MWAFGMAFLFFSIEGRRIDDKLFHSAVDSAYQRPQREDVLKATGGDALPGCIDPSRRGAPMIVQLMHAVTGAPIYVNPAYVVTVRPKPANPEQFEEREVIFETLPGRSLR
jgi:hypothetical protein